MTIYFEYEYWDVYQDGHEKYIDIQKHQGMMVNKLNEDFLECLIGSLQKMINQESKSSLLILATFMIIKSFHHLQ